MPSISSTHVGPVMIANSEQRELHSAIVGQKYLIKVRLPVDYYESDKRYGKICSKYERARI